MTSEEFRKIQEQLLNHERRLEKLESLIQTEAFTTVKKSDLSSFYYSKKPKTDIQKVLVICYYLENYLKMISFNTQDIEKGFR